jgi:hypothetical protein
MLEAIKRQTPVAQRRNQAGPTAESRGSQRSNVNNLGHCQTRLTVQSGLDRFVARASRPCVARPPWPRFDDRRSIMAAQYEGKMPSPQPHGQSKFDRATRALGLRTPAGDEDAIALLSDVRGPISRRKSGVPVLKTPENLRSTTRFCINSVARHWSVPMYFHKVMRPGEMICVSASGRRSVSKGEVVAALCRTSQG